MKSKTLALATLLLVTAFLLVTSVVVAGGCGGPGGATVKMTASGFESDHVTVKAGTSVTFENTTDSLFVIHFPDKLYGMGPHGTHTYKFNKSSTVDYQYSTGTNPTVEHELIVEVK